MKGIVLAGGTGSRLWPITKGICKQLLPVYNKPMVFFPISTLMLAGIREILVITTPQDQNSFKTLIGDGSNLGMEFKFQIQERPAGIAEAFIIGADFVGHDGCALVLGDNILHGHGFGQQLNQFYSVSGAQIFAAQVSDPQRYGILEFDENSEIVSIEEKPVHPKSNLAIPGLYFYDNQVLEIAKTLKPSMRGELEISTINQIYLENKKLKATKLHRGTAWFDAGTFESLHDASSYVRILEERQGNRIAVLEEISWRNGWINDSELILMAEKNTDKSLRDYLVQLVDHKSHH
jgi:glucose-1-phosphate thymidylyltransferase